MSLAVVSEGLVAVGSPRQPAVALVGAPVDIDYAARWGVVSYWKLDEASGTRSDSVGSNHLTSNNSVGQAAAKVGAASTQFVAASTQYLSIADNAALSAGVGVDIWGAAWVNLDSKTTRRGVMVKADGAGTNSTFEYGLTYESGSDRFEFTVGQGTGTVGLVDANTLGSPSIGTWYLLVWGYRAGVGLYLSGNGGAFDTAVFTTGVFDGTNPFWIGRAYANYMDGRIDAVAFGKSPPGGLTVPLLTEIRDRLYNGGAGREQPWR